MRLAALAGEGDSSGADAQGTMNSMGDPAENGLEHALGGHSACAPRVSEVCHAYSGALYCICRAFLKYDALERERS